MTTYKWRLSIEAKALIGNDKFDTHGHATAALVPPPIELKTRLS